jgi:hypothetical protein
MSVIIDSVHQVVPQLDNGPEEGARQALEKKVFEGLPGPFSFASFSSYRCPSGIDALQSERK